jgi:Na+/glutamate symporter
MNYFAAKEIMAAATTATLALATAAVSGGRCSRRSRSRRRRRRRKEEQQQQEEEEEEDQQQKQQAGCMSRLPVQVLVHCTTTSTSTTYRIYTLPRSEESYTAFIAGAILNKIAPQY